MKTTTIKLFSETKYQIDNYREYRNESYDEILRKLLFIVKNVVRKPQLSKDTVLEIEAARARIKEGEFYTEDEVKKMLNLK